MKQFFLYILLIGLLLSGCRAAPVSVDTDSVDFTQSVTADVSPTTDTTDTEPAVSETEAMTVIPDDMPTETTAAITEVPTEVAIDELPSPAQIRITFTGTPNRYDYIPCSVSVTDPAEEYDAIADGDSQIKVRGHSTSSGEKIPYNIKFSEKTELLGLGRSKKWNLLANLYDRTQLRNMLALNFARDIGLDTTSQTRYAELYVNGEYRGLYQICEPVDVGATELDLDTAGNEFLLELEPHAGYKSYYCLTTPRFGLLFGLNEPERPSGTQWNWLVSFMTAAEDALLSDDWEKVLKYIDVESFARCYIVQELFKNADYNVSSTRFYIKDGKLCEGPVWDFDLSAGNCSPSNYPDYNNVTASGLSYRGLHCVGLYNEYLFRYEAFQSLVSSLFEELQPIIVNLYSDNDLGINQIDRYVDHYRTEIDRNAELWSPAIAYSYLERKPVDGTYDAEIDYLRNWLCERNLWLYETYCKGE